MPLISPSSLLPHNGSIPWPPSSPILVSKVLSGIHGLFGMQRDIYRKFPQNYQRVVQLRLFHRFLSELEEGSLVCGLPCPWGHFS